MTYARTTKIKLLGSFVFAVLSLAFLFISLFVDVSVFAIQARSQLSNGSEYHKFLEQEIDSSHLSAYLFNITNAERFVSGEDLKLKVEEIGPFTYKEMRRHENMRFDEAAQELHYSPHVHLEFMPEQSVGDPRKMNITMPNIPMLGLTAKITSYPYLARMAFSVLTRQLNSKAIVNLDAHRYMWGYPEPIVSLAHTFMPELVTFEEMGIFSRIYDENMENNLVLSTEPDKKFMIKSRNGFTKLPMAENEDPTDCEKCSVFENTYEAVGYPNELTPDFPLRIFKNGLCKIMDMKFSHSKPMYYGGEALEFTTDDSFYKMDPNETSKGYVVLPDCFFGLPLGFSGAHFLGVDPKVYDRVEGIHPDEEKHRSYVSVEPRIGIEVETVFSLQMNLFVGDVSHSDETKSFSDMVVPICYVRLVQPRLPEDTIATLQLLYITYPKVLLAQRIVSFIVTIAAWAYFIRLARWQWRKSREEPMSINFPTEKPAKQPITAVEEPLVLNHNNEKTSNLNLSSWLYQSFRS